MIRKIRDYNAFSGKSKYIKKTFLNCWENISCLCGCRIHSSTFTLEHEKNVPVTKELYATTAAESGM